MKIFGIVIILSYIYISEGMGSFIFDSAISVMFVIQPSLPLLRLFYMLDIPCSFVTGATGFFLHQQDIVWQKMWISF